MTVESFFIRQMKFLYANLSQRGLHKLIQGQFEPKIQKKGQDMTN